MRVLETAGFSILADTTNEIIYERVRLGFRSKPVS